MRTVALRSSTVVASRPAILTDEEVGHIVKCLRYLTRISGLTPIECLALMEEATAPLNGVDRSRVLAPFAPAHTLRETIH